MIIHNGSKWMSNYKFDELKDRIKGLNFMARKL